MNIRDLAQRVIVAACDDPEIEGVTLLGGEPFEQAEAFADFAAEVRRAGLSVMVFTGYTREYLERDDSPQGAHRLIAATDLLVDGPYLADRKDILRPWVGSTNQKFHFLTDRYAHLAGTLGALPDRLEIRVMTDGRVAINGWATVDQLDSLLDDVTHKISRGQVR